MPVVITAVLPSYVTIDTVREIESDILDPAPEGLIAHAVTYDDERGAVRIIDMWESEAAHATFAEQTLAPSIRRVVQAHGHTPTAPDSFNVAEAVLFQPGRS